MFHSTTETHRQQQNTCSRVWEGTSECRDVHFVFVSALAEDGVQAGGVPAAVS